MEGLLLELLLIPVLALAGILAVGLIVAIAERLSSK